MCSAVTRRMLVSSTTSSSPDGSTSAATTTPGRASADVDAALAAATLAAGGAAAQGPGLDARVGAQGERDVLSAVRAETVPGDRRQPDVERGVRHEQGVQLLGHRGLEPLGGRGAQGGEGRGPLAQRELERRHGRKRRTQRENFGPGSTGRIGMPATLAKAIFEKNGMRGDVVDGRGFHDSDAQAGVERQGCANCAGRRTRRNP